MEVEIISRETIKPSSLTPPHLRTYKLSLLDQFIPSNHVPIVLFYPMLDNDHVHVTSQLLKKSLSKTLTRFYPLAGKVRDALTIDCNDEGAFYVEARVKCHLSDFLTQPRVPSMNQFLPYDVAWKRDEPISGLHVTIIQVNIFDCGGIAIGALVSHMTVDGTAFSTFLNSWAATARGSCEAVPRPSFIAPSLFLQSDSVPKELTAMGLLKHFLKRGDCVARRFIFDASALATLKAKATSSCGQSQSPSRVQAVSSLIWKCFIAASKATSGAYKPILLGHAVNMRPRALPPFSESCMGNFLWLAVAECKDEAKTELHHLAGQVNDAIAKVNGDLVKQLQGEEGSLKYCETLEEMRKALHEGADYLGFTSWCNFGLYEVDFGWGKPTWASPVGSGESISTIFYQNMVILIETKQGDGIEAWVSTDEQQMAIFQCDRELQIYASVDQSPLSLCN
ncbi:hypothetical protein CsSME_00013412 [Camellia sinensis var. sinensis]